MESILMGIVAARNTDVRGGRESFAGMGEGRRRSTVVIETVSVYQTLIYIDEDILAFSSFTFRNSYAGNRLW